MEIETVELGQNVVLNVQGEIDLDSAPYVGASLDRAEATAAATVVVDLAGVTFIDLSGVNLLATHKRARRDRLRVTGEPPQLRRLRELLGEPELLALD